MVTDRERESFAKVGQGSQWRENVFVGGFPGGEQFYLDWVDRGMTGDVPDLPEYLQSKTPFKESVDSTKKPGILARLDATEFFQGIGEAISGDKKAEPEETAPDPTVEMEVVPEGDAPPNPSLYEKYFPADRVNRAPEIIIEYYKKTSNQLKHRVGVAMREVTASPADLYFPKEMKGKAPVINIFYSGNLSTASVTVAMKDIEGLPPLVSPQPDGETVTSLVPGPGGGLKLDFAVQGQGPVNVYSDPRCIENFEKMLS